MISAFLAHIPGLSTFAATCQKSFFGLPPWYKYLDGADTCDPKLTHINDIWLILLALTDILLRLAIVIAIIFVLIGGLKYITSQANPEKTTRAKNTVIDALIGLVIAIIAIAVISFIAGRFN